MAVKYPNQFLLFIFVAFTGMGMATVYTNMPGTIMNQYAYDMRDYFGNTYDPYKGTGGSSNNDTISAFLSSGFFIGALIGSLVTDPIFAKLGRKATIIIFTFLAGVLCALCAIPIKTAYGWVYLIVVRVVIGFPAGIIQALTPPWISELSKPKFRGIMTVGIQLFLTFGILLANIVAIIINPQGGEVDFDIQTTKYWWVAFVVSAVILAIGGLLTFFMPETVGTEETPAQPSEGSATATGNSVELHATSVELKAGGLNEGAVGDKSLHDISFKDCFCRKDLRRCILVAFILPTLQQFTGINAVIMFADVMFATLGLYNAAYVGACIICAWNVVSTIVAVPIVDRLGRRVLLFTGVLLLLAMLIPLIPIGAIQAGLGKDEKLNTGLSALLGICIFLYILGFAAAPGPLVFTICGEMFPEAARVKFNSIAFAVHKITSIIVVFTFPYMKFNLAIPFGIYFVLTVILTVFTWLLVPETRGKSLEEIEAQVVNESVFTRFDMCGNVKK
ncbi:Hexose transporter [Giardia muris]|uniref:Hexose transporter n=1 Tax=Giardia muris TaxID=5742 RepID=A0A4Z1SUT8_GIAMU|nr:Hexose transporter [Giardia muris]|eukprot:TNJ29606.1 Hexose transporter [Giardia muris]